MLSRTFTFTVVLRCFNPLKVIAPLATKKFLSNSQSLDYSFVIFSAICWASRWLRLLITGTRSIRYLRKLEHYYNFPRYNLHFNFLIISSIANQFLFWEAHQVRCSSGTFTFELGQRKGETTKILSCTNVDTLRTWRAHSTRKNRTFPLNELCWRDHIQVLTVTVWGTLITIHDNCELMSVNQEKLNVSEWVGKR